MLRELFDLPGGGAVSKQVRGEIPIRKKIDRVANPHRPRVVTVRPRQLLDRIVGQVHHLDRVSATATIVTPHTGFVPIGSKRQGDLVVRDALGIR